MKRSVDGLLCTHTGGLIRPRELRGATSASDYWERLERSVNDVVAKQALIGLDIVNDGEYCKSDGPATLLNALPDSRKALRKGPALARAGRCTRFADALNREFLDFISDCRHFAASAISYTDEQGLRRRLRMLRLSTKRTSAEESFFTIVAPGSAAFNGLNRHYENDRAYVFAG